MSPKDHAILGALGAAALYPVVGLSPVVFWLGAVFIDLDHYIDYIYRNGMSDFSPSRMVSFFHALDNFWPYPEFIALSVFHTFEFMAPFALLTLWSGSALVEALFFGFLFHIALDIIYLLRQGAVFVRALSIAEYIIRRRRLVEQGYRPAAVYENAISIVKGRKEKYLYY